MLLLEELVYLYVYESEGELGREQRRVKNILKAASSTRTGEPPLVSSQLIFSEFFFFFSFYLVIDFSHFDVRTEPKFYSIQKVISVDKSRGLNS